MATIQFRGNAGDLARFVQSIPAILSGKEPDPMGLAKELKLRVGVALLSQVQQDYIRKSRGETGKDGERWAPLKPRTIARRRTTRAELKKLGIKRKGIRRSLTDSQNAAWKRLFVYHFRLGLRDMPRIQAKRRAAAIAWARIKEDGAKTLLDLLGSRKVDILRDTGARLRSFEPGVDDRPSEAPGQIFRTMVPGVVVVGSTEKPWHQDGDDGRGLPARRAWPKNGKIPPAWMPPIRKAGTRGLAVIVRKFLGG